MVCIMFFKLILIKRCLYNQGYIEKDVFLLKPSKSEVVKNFCEKLSKIIISKLWCIYINNFSQTWDKVSISIF